MPDTALPLRAVVLAGGLGSRLRPMTRIVNKHLLPVYDRPMIYFPLQQLAAAGFDEVLVITGEQAMPSVAKALGRGTHFGFDRIEYAEQRGEGGIAEALELARGYAAGAPVMVLLGDNLFEDSLVPHVEAFRRKPHGARILLKEVPDPARFGVVRFENQGGEERVVEILEKPDRAPSPWAVTGCYFYDARVFDWIPELERSSRGELEITDINNRYISMGEMRHDRLSGWWSDAGTVPSLLRAANLVEQAMRSGSLPPVPEDEDS